MKPIKLDWVFVHEYTGVEEKNVLLFFWMDRDYISRCFFVKFLGNFIFCFVWYFWLQKYPKQFKGQKLAID